MLAISPDTLKVLLGFAGVVGSNGIALTLAKPVLEARRTGSLAGLDTRLWPLNVLRYMLWTGYSIALGDVWLFLSSLPAAVLWLFFNLTTVELLFQEEGELSTPMSSPRKAFEEKRDFSFQEGSMNFDFDNMESQHDVSSKHRMHLIHKAERVICISVLITGFVSFALTPEAFIGFEALSGLVSKQARVKAFGYACMTISLICFAEPAKKVRAIWLKRDATSVFVPFLLMGVGCNTMWLGYGILTGNAAVIIPQCVGMTNYSLLLILRCIFGTGPEETVADEKAGENDVIGIPAAWGVLPSPAGKGRPTSATSAPAFFGRHMRIGSKTSDSSHASSARSHTRLVSGGSAASMPRKTTAGSDNDIANVADVEELQLSTTSGLALPPGAVGPNPLPDLTGRLQELGVYEDYLKWQRDYQKWRQGGARGAQGDVRQVGIPQFASEKAPGVIPEADVEKEMSMKLRDVEK